MGALKIVYIADVPSTGGASDCLVELTQTLQDYYDVHCAVLTPERTQLNTRLSSCGVDNYVTGHGAFLSARSDFTPLNSYAVPRDCRRWLRGLATSISRAESVVDFAGVDLIHSNLPRNDLGILLAKRHGLPHVAHLRESSFEHFRCVSFRPIPARYVSRNSTAMIAVSRYVREAWSRAGADRGRISVIYDGIDPKGYEAVRDKRGKRDGGTIRLLFLGGCSEGKGIWDAVKAVELIVRRGDSQVVLDVYGEGSRYTESLVRCYVRRRGLSEVVHINGRTDNVPSVIQSHDIGLVCTRAEAFGRVVCEFQIAGLPVVGPDTGSIPELIEEGEGGFIYSKSVGPESLAGAIMKAVGLVGREIRPTRIASRTRFEVADEVHRLYCSVLRLGRPDEPSRWR